MDRVKKTKDLKDIEHVDILKQLVKWVLDYLKELAPQATPAQETLLDNHIDNTVEHSKTHDQNSEILENVDNLTNMVDPVEIEPVLNRVQQISYQAQLDNMCKNDFKQTVNEEEDLPSESMGLPFIEEYVNLTKHQTLCYLSLFPSQ